MYSTIFLVLILLGRALATAAGQAVTVAAREEKRNNTDSSPAPIQLKKTTATGTGCPDGSYSHNIATDRSAYMLTFSQFVASIRPGVPASQSKKDCHIKFDLHNPGGYQYSILGASYRGFFDMGASVAAVLKNSYAFSQHNSRKKATYTFTGPQATGHVKTDEVPYKTMVWSPCGKDTSLQLDTTLAINSTDQVQQGAITLDSMDGEFQQKCHIAWRRCETAQPTFT